METRGDAEPIPTDRPALSEGRVVGFVLDDVEPGSVTAHLGFQSGDRVETVNEGNVVSLAEALDGARQVEKLAGPGPDTWRVWPSALAEPCLPRAEWPARMLLVPRYFANYSFIQRVNDTPVDGPDAYCAALLKAIDGAEVSFEVSRRRKTFEHVHQLAWDDDLEASVLGRRSSAEPVNRPSKAPTAPPFTRAGRDPLVMCSVFWHHGHNSKGQGTP